MTEPLKKHLFPRIRTVSFFASGLSVVTTSLAIVMLFKFVNGFAAEGQGAVFLFLCGFLALSLSVNGVLFMVGYFQHFLKFMDYLLPRLESFFKKRSGSIQIGDDLNMESLGVILCFALVIIGLVIYIIHNGVLNGIVP